MGRTPDQRLALYKYPRRVAICRAGALGWLALGMSLLASPTAIGDEVSAASAPGALADLRMNQLQVRGTHNSYHLYPRFFGIPFLPFAVHRSHRYEHPPLVE